MIHLVTLKPLKYIKLFWMHSNFIFLAYKNQNGDKFCDLKSLKNVCGMPGLCKMPLKKSAQSGCKRIIHKKYLKEYISTNEWNSILCLYRQCNKNIKHSSNPLYSQ